MSLIPSSCPKLYLKSSQRTVNRLLLAQSTPFSLLDKQLPHTCTDENTTDIRHLKGQNQKCLPPFPDLSLTDLKTLPSGCFFKYSDWILTSEENADSYVTKLKVIGKTKHLFRRYSVYFYRDMLSQIIASGRFANAHSTIHISVYPTGISGKKLPAAPDPATVTGGSSSDAMALALLLSWSLWTVCLGVLLPQAFLWVCCSPPRAVAQGPREMLPPQTVLLFACWCLLCCGLFSISDLSGEDLLCLSRIMKTYTFIYKCINI